MPNVCDCILMQDRVDPDNQYVFLNKCITHAGMSDIDARAAIIQLCIQHSEANSGN